MIKSLSLIDQVPVEQIAKSRTIRHVGMTYIIPYVPPLKFTYDVFDNSQLMISLRADEMRYLVPDKEGGITAAIRDKLDEGDTFLDIGSHIGYYAVLANELAGEDGEVIAFEPLPENAERIREQAALNDREIRVQETALSDSVGEAEIFVPEKRYNATLVEGPNENPEVRVSVSTVDAWTASHDIAPDLIKIDVEGSELEVLMGMRETMSTYKPEIICEIEGRERRRTKTILQAFIEEGYTLQKLPEFEEYDIDELVEFALDGGENEYGMDIQLHVLAT